MDKNSPPKISRRKNKMEQNTTESYLEDITFVYTPKTSISAWWREVRKVHFKKLLLVLPGLLMHYGPKSLTVEHITCCMWLVGINESEIFKLGKF